MKAKAIVSSVIFTVLTAATIIIRVMQSAAMIDPKTGFYYPEYEIFEPLFLIVLFALIAAYFVTAMLTVKYPPLHNYFIESKTLGIITAAFAAVTAFRTVEYVLNISRGIALSEYVLLIAFVAFFIFLLIFSIMLLRGMRTPSELFLIPSLFAAIRFIVTFISYVDVIKVTDIILTITMLGFTMMFWHMFARINAGMATKSTVKMMFGFGFPAALLCFACSVPKYYMNWFLPNTSIHISEHISYFDFAAGIYIAVFLIMALCSKIESRENTVSDEL